MSELDTTSNQHTNAVQEQVAAVQQVTSSLEELGETAKQIANSAQGVSVSAYQMVSITSQVNEGGEKARAFSEEGETAVVECIKSVGSLRERIELTAQRMLNVTSLTGRVTAIVDILDEIAEETHLLALNASIEAAGSISSGSDNSELSQQYPTAAIVNRNGAGERIRGARFGVIAQEIKNLADRSRDSTEEARQILTEMQGAVAAAVLVAEEGKKATGVTLSRTQIAGGVIGKLNEVITDMVAQFEQVLIAAQAVRGRSEEISLATTQQRSANEQIVQTMRSIAEVSGQSASAIIQIAFNVSGIKDRIDELNTVLEDNATSSFSNDEPDLPPGAGTGTGRGIPQNNITRKNIPMQPAEMVL